MRLSRQSLASPAPCSCPCSRDSRRASRRPAPRWQRTSRWPGCSSRSPLPHLDRPFDYSVPADLDAAAQAGVRVKVKFNGQELAGFIMERAAESDAGHTLVPAAQSDLPGRRPHARPSGTWPPPSPPATPEPSAMCSAPRFRRALPGWRRSSSPGAAPEAPAAGSRADNAGRSRHSAVAAAVPARCRLGGLPQRPGVCPAPAGRRFPAGGVQPAPGLRPGGLAAAGGRRPWQPSAPPAAAPWWWFPTTATWTGWKRRSWRCCPPSDIARLTADDGPTPPVPELPARPGRLRAGGHRHKVGSVRSGPGPGPRGLLGRRQRSPHRTAGPVRPCPRRAAAARRTRKAQPA